ncbi:polysaccharide deacetylase family protein [Streptococcus xiaochunlingii]|uniref:polysaccharide deacetylase family protein n=1 Tax=Streptococcus xiaochunlingii TaxID=2589788 RepID=UPI002556834F|nr:polysaccharide deacetylase family protein [Streptococcus xiaochunlingii]MDK8387003.1 polysaccharide deacetylase family protein [Streptococcus xiaochunlingii]MDK8777358.1 polysaccharide deacetylase family protein [Streptococcus xiaochunlingii]
MNHRKRRVPKKIRLLLILNAFLLSCIFILGFLLLKRAASTPVADKQETNTSQTVNQQGSTTKWVKQDQPVKIPILMYHAVHTMDPSEEANANLIVAPETFESHLKALKEAGYYTLTPEEAYRALTKNELPEGRKVVWLTFDDGIADFYTIVYPLLKKYQMTATNNIITSFSDEERPSVLTFDQIKEMKAQGMTFESHTVSHPDLAQSDSSRQKSELANSKQVLDKKLNQTTTTIVYPAGRYSDVTMELAEKNGYKMGLTTNNGLASLDDGLYSLNRLRILPTTTAKNLLAEMQTNP